MVFHIINRCVGKQKLSSNNDAEAREAEETTSWTCPRFLPVSCPRETVMNAARIIYKDYPAILSTLGL